MTHIYHVTTSELGHIFKREQGGFGRREGKKEMM